MRICNLDFLIPNDRTNVLPALFLSPTGNTTYRPEPGRGPGRPPLIVEEPAPPPEPLPSLSTIERRDFDYSDLEQSMAQLNLVLRETRRSLDVLTGRVTPATQATSTRVGEEDDEE